MLDLLLEAEVAIHALEGTVEQIDERYRREDNITLRHLPLQRRLQAAIAVILRTLIKLFFISVSSQQQTKMDNISTKMRRTK